MRVIRREKGSISLSLTASELDVIGNALNESLESIEEWEFATRMGATKKEVEALQQALAKAEGGRADD